MVTVRPTYPNLYIQLWVEYLGIYNNGEVTTLGQKTDDYVGECIRPCTLFSLLLS